MTYEEFIKKYLGQSIGYPSGSYVGQCLSIVKLYILECFEINPPASGSGSAYGYWSNFPNPLGTVFEKVENNPNLIPEKGWIVIWKPWSSNQYGHIAIVADGCTTGTLKNYAQNWTSKIFQLESNRYTNVIGFLKPKSSIIEEDMTTDEKRALELLESYKIANKHGNLEGAINALFGASNDLQNKTKEIETLTNSIKTLEAQLEAVNAKVAELEAKFVTNQKELKTCQTACQTANNSIENISNDLKDMTTDRDSWRDRYNKKNDQYNELLKNKISMFSKIISWVISFIKKLHS